MVAVILPVTHNHVVKEMYSHTFARLFERLGQLVVNMLRRVFTLG